MAMMPIFALIKGNKIHNNTIGGFNNRWAGGGAKLIGNERTILEDNEVYDNHGAGLWCDIECRDIVIKNNCIHHNQENGIFFEISSGAEIFGNRVFHNGYGFPDWGWGSGIIRERFRFVTMSSYKMRPRVQHTH